MADTAGRLEGAEFGLGLHRPAAGVAGNAVKADGQVAPAGKADHVVHGDAVVTGPGFR